MNPVRAAGGAAHAAAHDAGARPLPDAPELAAQLARACTALWSATLSLMAAFMQTSAPAHRYLIARRIARNLATLHEQDCFNAASRASFLALSRRWSDKADRLAPEEQRPRGGLGLLPPRLFHR